MKQAKHLAGQLLAWLWLLVEKICKYLFFLLPVKRNKVLFVNFNGKGFGCNPKYIAMALLGEGYDLVWPTWEKDAAFPEGIRRVPYRSIRALWEAATAKVIVTNVKNDLRILKKRSQYIIHTWHGSYSAKLVEREVEDKLHPKYVKESKHHSAMCDLFLSNSRLLSQRYRDSFWYEGEILECGFPRNDVLFYDGREKTAAVKHALGLPEDAKLALYAPTFRDDGDTACYGLDTEAVLKTLGDGWYLLIRLHPNVTGAEGLFPFGARVVDACGYPDMQELLVASDILITDYSSTVFEFAALGKPSFLFATDVERYRRTRGLKEEFFSMPYPVCTDMQQLCHQLESFTPEHGQEAARQFMARYGGVDKGDASRQVADRIRQVMGRS